MRDILLPLNYTGQNVTLVDVVMRSILPASPHLLSAQQVADAVETKLQTKEDIWPSWTVRLFIDSYEHHSNLVTIIPSTVN